MLSAEIRATRLLRLAERAKSEAESDFLTGLYNRRGWDLALTAEEARCVRYGHPACVIAIDLDGLKRVNDTRGHEAGDELIMRAASTLRNAVRNQDVVARVGGDEFLVLAVECDAEGSNAIVERITSLLDQSAVEASIGMARRNPASNFGEAVREADRRMYADKRRRKQARQSTPS